MRIFLKWLAAGVALAACGGNVVVDAPGGGSTVMSGSTTSTHTFSTTFSTTNTCDFGCGGSISSGTFSSSSSSGSTTSTTCHTCNDWLSHGVPSSSICSGSSASAYMDLTACACAGGPCSTNCETSLCITVAPGQSCNACLMSSCAMQIVECRDN
jgi:hypothetical protein